MLVSSKFADVLGQLAAQKRQLDRIQASLGRSQWQLREAMTALRSPQGGMQRMGGFSFFPGLARPRGVAMGPGRGGL